MRKQAAASSIMTPVGNMLLKPLEFLFGLPVSKVKPLYDTVSYPMAAAFAYQSALPYFMDKFPTEYIYSRAIDPGKILSFAPYRSEHFQVFKDLTNEASVEIQELRRKQEEEAKQRLLSQSGSGQLTLESMFKDIDARIK